jgi:hypothetical protein
MRGHQNEVAIQRTTAQRVDVTTGDTTVGKILSD